MWDREGKRKYLNRVERDLFAQAVRSEPDRKRQAFCLVLLYSECRLSEALELSPDGVDFKEGALVFRTLKRRSDSHFRAIPVPKALLRRLENIIPSTKNEGKFWQYSRTTAWRIVKRTMVKAGISGMKATPKGLRHGFAVACLVEQISVITLRKWLGHARLETTAVYLDLMGEDERRLAKRTWLGAT